jgi:sugar phosphate isomerase/epimerase
MQSGADPRLSVSALCSFPWSFAQDLALWERLGVRQVGLLGFKLDDHGSGKAIAALRERDIRASCIIAGSFDLSRPASWGITRDAIARAVDGVRQLDGRCVYITSGRTTGRVWNEMLEVFATAVEPSIERAGGSGVRLALEPLLRTQVSFVHSMRDAIDVADRTGIALVADLGNCWMERDLERTLARAGERIALVQLCDVSIGTMAEPGPEGRVVPGDGELDIDRFLRSIAAANYRGPYELEVLGPAIDAEGYETAVRRGIEATGTLLANALGEASTSHD